MTVQTFNSLDSALARLSVAPAILPAVPRRLRPRPGGRTPAGQPPGRRRYIHAAHQEQFV